MQIKDPRTKEEISAQNRKNAAVKKMSPAEKAARTPSSKAFAIAAYCYHTCHAELEPNSHKTKHNIANCEQDMCELWPHRPWQKLTKK
jgi:hypothetical protein